MIERRHLWLALLLGFFPACQSRSDKTDTVTDTVCPDAEKRLGRRVCVHEVPDEKTWTEIAFEAAAVDQARVTTFLLPAKDNARLATLFVDASAFESPSQSLHYKFLTESFPEFALLEYEEYLELILPSDREWFAGSLTELIAPGEPSRFGFTVWDSGVDPASTISCAQFRAVLDVMKARVRIGEVVAMPSNDLQRKVLKDCDVPARDPLTALDYEVYTRARGCGTVRRYTLAELASAETDAAFGWQDILVTAEAPLDIETVISGIVTGTRQGELSHLNVRSASRGTPNCYVKDAHELLAEWEGRLVELECGPDQATVVEITPEEAKTCWEGLRPDPVEVVPADLEWTELVGLLDVPADTASERRTAVSRFGSKGANLGTLYQRIEADLQLMGFLIPFHYYDAFVEPSFEETIDRYLDDDLFTSDGAVRRERLAALQAEMEAAPCDPALVEAIGAEILEVFGADDVMVRFRSSSNAEDALGFNGAGLYSSTSVCLADETDGDAAGPSRCDPDEANERDVCRGLTRVWASLWNMKAYEEREWYGIDHREVAMGILVNTRSKGELANIVAFTGNPLVQGDDRFLVNAQLGELDVVSAVPGVWPEKVLLAVEDGEVTTIERVKGSTELPEGEWVLDNGRLEDLGASLARIAEVYPVDEAVPETADVLLDTEWKILRDGRLVVKQVRPFLW